MVLRPLFLMLVCWSQWHLAAFGQDKPWPEMEPPERLARVNRLVNTELNHMDSARAFLETNQLLEHAQDWDAPEVVADVYVGQGDYLLQICHATENARTIYTKGLDFCLAKRLQEHSAYFLMRIAKSYWLSNDQATAYEYYLRAHDVFAGLGFERVVDLDRYEYEIGSFLYAGQEYKAALEHLSIADLFPGRLPQVRHEVLTLMGKCCLRLEQVDDAICYFQKSFKLAKQGKETGYMGSASIHIGACQLLKKQYLEARFSLSTGSKWSEQAGQPADVARASILMSQVHVQAGNLYAAAQKLTEAEALLQSAGDAYLYADLYQGWMTVHEGRDNFREAYRYRYLQDSMLRFTDIGLRNPSNSAELLKGRLRALKFAQEKRIKQEDRQMTMLLTCLFLLLCTGLYAGWKNLQRRQKDLTFANRRAEQLEQALQQYAEQQEAKFSPLIVRFTDEGPEQLTEEVTAQGVLDQLLELNLHVDGDSRQFRHIFEALHPGFFERFPKLTPSEIRLLALTKLELSTKEVAEILHIEANSVRRLRNRIRQKYGLPAGDNFENLLADNGLQENFKLTTH